MRLFNRNISLLSTPAKTLKTIKTVIQIYQICKNPSTVTKAYLLRRNPEFVELKSGLKVYMSSCRDDISTFVIVFCNKDYGNLKGNKLVIDVGANIGIVSMYAISQGALKVYSFEPNKEAFGTIEKSINANQLQERLIAFNMAVSSKTGELLYIPKKSNPANVSQKNVGQLDLYDAIPTISMDDFINQHQIDKIDLLKLDCEGAEYVLLPSLSELNASKICEIKIEYHDEEAPLLDWLKKKQFKVTYFKKVKAKLGYIWASR